MSSSRTAMTAPKEADKIATKNKNPDSVEPGLLVLTTANK